MDGISIVIPFRNRFPKLEICVNSVLESWHNLQLHNKDIQVEIILIDDRSTLNSRFIFEKFQQVKVFKNQGIGPGAARNQGIKKSSFDLIAFIDSDCSADKFWLQNIYNEFVNEETIIVQGDPCLFQRKNNSRLGEFEERLYKGMFLSYLAGDYSKQLDTRNCAFRKSITTFYGSKVFNEDMSKAQAEARVLGLRIHESGLKIKFSKQSKVYHEDPPSIFNSMKQKFRHGSGRIHVWKGTPSIEHLFRRYFYYPIFKLKIPAWYVIPTHIAFILGYFYSRLFSRGLNSKS